MPAIKGKKIFITGGAGFIASYISEHLIKDNKIVTFDNNTRNALKFSQVAKHPNLTAIEGDVRDVEALKKAMKGAEIVIHCAAIAGIYSVVKSPSITLKVNFLGTYNTLEAAVHHKVKKFMDFSTSEVYGPFVYKGTEDDLTSQGPVGESRWAYAVSKLAAEHLTHAYHKEFNLPIVTVRPFNVYGPRQVGEGAIRGMVMQAIKNEPITIYNDGSQIRAWCYAEDFVDGILRALSVPEAQGHTFNIGNPRSAVSNIKLAQTIIRLAKSKSKIIFKEHPGPEVEVRIPSISKAQKILDFNPQVDLEEGITRTIAWYRKTKE